MNESRVVTKIEANPLLIKEETEILNVCAYIRVSTEEEEQLKSFESQFQYYSEYVAKHPEWRLYKVYADKGITGTQVKNREEFKKMIRDCESKKIDLILTKSIARFARNVVDSLRYIRKLKKLGIGVFFEEQNINTLKIDSEMLIGFHSVLAQAESENISANVRWGIRQRMRSGTYSFRYNLLGYKKGEDGKPKIVKEEAEIIKDIYNKFLDGLSLREIKKYLEENNILTYSGKKCWDKSTIRGILTNEKYAGDMLLQKTYIENCLSKKIKTNRGELDKYLITNNHPAIIDKKTFQLTQIEISKRITKVKTAQSTTKNNSRYSGKYALNDILYCGKCGCFYRRKTWVINGNKKIVWRCSNRIENGKKYCRNSITIEEEKLKKIIVQALNKIIEDKEEIINLLKTNILCAITNDDVALNIYSIDLQINELSEIREKTIEMRMNTEGDKKRYNDQIINLTNQIEALRDYLKLEKEKLQNNEKYATEIQKIDEIFLAREVEIEKYNELLIRRLISSIKVEDEKLVIILKGGLKIEEKI
mgnify:FL=1